MNLRNPIASLMIPKTGSTVCCRNWSRARPAAVAVRHPFGERRVQGRCRRIGLFLQIGHGSAVRFASHRGQHGDSGGLPFGRAFDFVDRGCAAKSAIEGSKPDRLLVRPQGPRASPARRDQTSIQTVASASHPGRRLFGKGLHFVKQAVMSVRF
jgi:hypothetical protein